MKVSRQWLADYVGIDRSNEEIEEALTLIGFEVEGIETVGVPMLEKVVVGEVLTCEQHPNADRLSVCTVNVGADEPAGIVCGAKNFKVGDRVPVALPGAKLPGGFKIKKSKLRGVPSAGMMCSASELNLSDDHAGLLILEERPEVGTPINEVFPEPDTVFDIEVTPNRPDCLSVIGIGRELAAWFQTELKYPEIHHDVSGAHEGSSLLRAVDVRDQGACPRYCAWSVRGVRIQPSPEWMQRRLRAVGLRPINNVVDCTNYVLMELGQPLHAFDSSKIAGDRLEIRRAVSGEKLTTLDEKERVLNPADLVIADEERALVIAGVMGSVDAEVDETTTDVVLEVAAFESIGIRSTSRRLGLSTDSSYRFERGVDPSGIDYAAARCIDLILETAGGSVTGKPFSVGKILETVTEISVSPSQIVERIGFVVEPDEIAEAWERLEMEISRAGGAGESWTVRVPSFRQDVGRVADLTEEFLRMYGTDRIPVTAVETKSVSALVESPVDSLATAAREHFVANGFLEAFNYSLVDASEVILWQGRAASEVLGLENPLAQDQSHLRPSLLSGLLEVVRFNRGRARKGFRFFESGRVFREMDGRVTEMFAIAFAVSASPEKNKWMSREEFDFYHARRLIEDTVALAGLALDAGEIQLLEKPSVWAHKRAAYAGVGDGGQVEWGAFAKSYLEAHGIEDPVFGGEFLIDPTKLSEDCGLRGEFEAPSAFPRSVKDIAVVCPADLLAETARRRIAELAREGVSDFSVEEVRIFDVYQGKGLVEGSKSIALTIAYGAMDRTLNDKEVGQAFEDLQKRIEADTLLSMR